MPCSSMRQMSYEREQEEERKRKKDREAAEKKKTEERRKLKKREKARKLKEQIEELKKERERYEKAIATVKSKATSMGWLAKSTGHSNQFMLTKGPDLMEVKVLYDGQIRVNTPGTISQPNHASADGLLDSIAQALKGKWKVLTRHFHGGVAHTHTHVHTH